MREVLLFPFSIIFNEKYNWKSYIAEFFWLIICIWLLGTWIQLLSPLFPEYNNIDNGIKQYISWFFSYYAALFPTIVLASKNKNITSIWMVVIIVFWTLSIWISKIYSIPVLIFNISLTIITLYFWVFINHEKFIKGEGDIDKEKEEEYAKFKKSI